MWFLFVRKTYRHPKCRSRLIIKNLPLYITEPKLRAHLASKPQPGELTDVRLVHKKDGSTRRIAFIGYKTEEEAQSAREYFDRSYLDISRLKVETVTGTKDAPVNPKKRKRLPAEIGEEEDTENRAGKRQKLDARSAKLEVKDPSPDPPKKSKKDRLDEFQKVMGVKSNSRPAWAADVEPVEMVAKDAKSKRIPSQAKEKENKENDEEDLSQREEEPEEIDDMEWMRRRMLASEIKADKEFEQSDDEEMKDETKPEEPKVQVIEEPEDPNRTTILSNGRLFVRNLVFTCTEDELRNHFSKHGDIEEVHIPLDASSSPKGFAYIRFKDSSHAWTAQQELDGTSFQGRLLHILPAVDRNPRPTNETGNNKITRLKDARAQQKKETSGKDFNWAVLYMNSDAVANSIAERLGIPKADILNPDGSTIGGSPAVKLALAETHIIAETKKYLEDHKVDLSLFSRPRTPRSKTIILVKNIPYGTTSSQLSEMFNAFANVKRVLLPPAGTIAIVEFPEGKEQEASNAWKGLAYKRLKDSVLYLEWAPEGLFDGSPEQQSRADTLTSTRDDKEISIDTDLNEDEEEVPSGATLYVGNLSFATTSERLSSLFRHLQSFAFARVATKADPKRAGEVLSQGFGFVGFKDVESAKRAIKGISTDGLVLDGHVLKVSFAGRGKEDVDTGIVSKSNSKSKSTKIIVKNLAFEVSKKELWELFSAHGQVKSVRIPNRADRRSRGFAFVDFATRKEAENAMERLRHTHLLGRHLVMEWAEKEKGIEEMRQKTLMQFGDGVDHNGTDLGRKEKLRLGLSGAEVDSDAE